MPAILTALGLLLLVGIGVGWLVWREMRAPLQILIVATGQDPAISGLAPGEERALGALMRDQLEYQGGATVTLVSHLPEDLAFIQGAPRTWVVALEPRRQGNALSLSYRAFRAQDFRTQESLPWRIHASDALPPNEAVDHFLQAFHRGPASKAGRFMPASPELFWVLMRASSMRIRGQNLEVVEDLTRWVVQREPECALGWMLLGQLHYQKTLSHPGDLSAERAETEGHFQRALALVPHHPPSAMGLALLRSDTGNHREALDLLVAARKRHPHSSSLLNGISYVAQEAGMLPLARKALELEDRNVFKRVTPRGVDIVYLYTGEWDRFEASLRTQPGHHHTTGGVMAFDRGYLALLRQDRTLAHQEFHQAAALTGGYPHLQRLSRIYDLMLEERTSEALREARVFDEDRVGMQEPDGELNLRLAEAYALMGDRGRAMELCTRAFARGFGYTEWFERSPFLTPLRDLPRWKLLIQHMKERQELLEERFPLKALEASVPAASSWAWA